jgi:hypothetical protein
MGKYGRIAVEAVRAVERGETDSPREAWETAARKVLPEGSPSRDNDCPRSGFVGLR